MPRKQNRDPQDQPPAFETAMAELESLVQRMESGDLSLETSLQEFERGVQLIRLCQDALKAAEQRVRLVVKDGQERDLPAPGDA